MAIVRGDRRESAIESIAEMRQGLGDALLRVDAIQASLDDLEFVLGLANEGEQEGRGGYRVMHFPEGEADGHSVDACAQRGCDDKEAEAVAADLEGELGGGEGDTP